MNDFSKHIRYIISAILLFFCITTSGCSDGDEDISFTYHPFAQSSKYGYVTVDGKVVIPPTYDAASYFEEGYASVKANGSWYFLRADGSVSDPFNFDELGTLSEGWAVFKNEDGYGFINPKGRILITGIGPAKPFSNGYAAARLPGGVVAYIDTNGNRVFHELSISKANSFSEGYATVLLDREFSANARFGVIDRNGVFVSPNRYPALYGIFGDGLCAARFEGDGAYPDEDDVVGYINARGEAVIRHEDWSHVEVFHEGYAFVIRGGHFGIYNGARVLANDGEWLIIDTEDRVLSSGNYWSNVTEFSQGYAAVSGLRDGVVKDYFVDPTGEQAFDAVFDQASSFYRGLAQIESGGRIGYLRLDGEIMWWDELTY